MLFSPHNVSVVDVSGALDFNTFEDMTESSAATMELDIQYGGLAWLEVRCLSTIGYICAIIFSFGSEAS